MPSFQLIPELPVPIAIVVKQPNPGDPYQVHSVSSGTSEADAVEMANTIALTLANTGPMNVIAVLSAGNNIRIKST